jgi:hypothetical protein
MTQHRLKEVCSVDNTKSSNLKLSSEKPTTTSTKFLGQHAFIVAHVGVKMNFNNKQ